MHACFDTGDPGELERSHGLILEALHHEVLAGRIPLDAARVERFRRLYLAMGVEPDPELAALTAASYRDRYKAAHSEVRGAAALLEAVRAHARVVIVSNNLLEEQRTKLRACGLAAHVDVLVVSEEAGMPKPDPRIFEIALQRAGVTAAEAVMVGDSWANDIEGARAAGIRAIWFNREGAAPPDPGVELLTSLEPTRQVLARLIGASSSRLS